MDATVSERPMKTRIGSRSYECATMLRTAKLNGRMICDGALAGAKGDTKGQE